MGDIHRLECGLETTHRQVVERIGTAMTICPLLERNHRIGFCIGQFCDLTSVGGIGWLHRDLQTKQ